MPEFYFQIKGKRGEPTSGMYGGSSNWSFPPIWQDKIEAADITEAKIKIEELYDKKFPLRVLKKDLESNEFLLSITTINEDNFWTKKLFDVNECKSCGSKFMVIEKYQIGNDGGGWDYCTSKCRNDNREKGSNILEYREDNAIHDYVIYKITNRETSMCYIGQTKQAFTFRWYQHFYQSSDVKFHEAIRSFPITAWTFEVIEVVDIPEDIKHDKSAIRNLVNGKETEYIRKFNSIKNGYNSVKSKDDGIDDPNQVDLNFNVEEARNNVE